MSEKNLSTYIQVTKNAGELKMASNEKEEEVVDFELALTDQAISKSIRKAEQDASKKIKKQDDIKIEDQEAKINRKTTMDKIKEEEEQRLLQQSTKKVIFNNESFNGSPDDDCFMIISLVSAQLPQGSEETLKRITSKWNPYIRVKYKFTNSEEYEKIYTKILWRSTTSTPVWHFFKKVSLPSCLKNYDLYPDEIIFELWDQYFMENDGKDSECIGKFVLKPAEKYLYDVETKFYETVELEDGLIEGCKMTIGFSFQCESEQNLRKKETINRQILKDIINERTFKWLDENIDLYIHLYEQEKQGKKINVNESFAKIKRFPVGFTKIFYEEYENFIARFGHVKNEDGSCRYSIYLDTDTRLLYCLRKSKDNNLECGGIDITNYIHLVWRFVYLKDILKGQDAEFNIYRSYYFDNIDYKLPLSLTAVLLQLTLCAVVTVDIVQNWDPDLYKLTQRGRRQDFLILIVSIIVFSGLSMTTFKTVELYLKFYTHLYLGFDIPLYFVLCDWISNCFVTIYITLASFFFLSQSPDYGNLALNAFALQFIYEIDDIFNVFENDEEEVIQKELRVFVSSGYVIPRVFNIRIIDFWPVIMSPFSILYTTWWAIKAFVLIFCGCKHKKKRSQFKIKEYHHGKSTTSL